MSFYSIRCGSVLFSLFIQHNLNNAAFTPGARFRAFFKIYFLYQAEYCARGISSTNYNMLQMSGSVKSGSSIDTRLLRAYIIEAKDYEGLSKIESSMKISEFLPESNILPHLFITRIQIVFLNLPYDLNRI